MSVNLDMTIADVLREYPEAAQVLRGFGMHCFGCAVASGESLREAAEVHGIDPDKLLLALQKETAGK